MRKVRELFSNILTESKVIYSPKDISQLALDLESKFDVKGTITLANMGRTIGMHTDL